jgi:hypothetical protein
MVLVTADFRHVIRLSAVMIQESDVWNWNPLGITDHQSAPQFALDMVVASQQNLNSDLTVLLPIAQSMETVRSLAKCSCVVVKKPNIRASCEAILIDIARLKYERDSLI